MPFSNPHPLYSVWQGIKRRCYNPNFKQFHRYGGRGITVCNRWRSSFTNFLSDMGPRPEGYQIDRIDNDGDYTPENCRWTTSKINMRNKGTLKSVSIDGRLHLVCELSEKFGLKPDTIVDRATRGLDFAGVTSRERFFNLDPLKLGSLANGARQKAKTHCPKGHEYTEANTSISKEGWRRCKACRRKNH